MTRPRARREVDWTSVADVALPDLRAGDAAELVPEADLDGLVLDELDLAGAVAAGAGLTECLLRACVLDGADLRRTRWAQCGLEDVRATSLDVHGSTWRDVVVRGSRLGALVAHGADRTRVTVAGSRLDFVNLRGATASQLQLVGCRVGELDLGQARLTDVRFVDCRVDRLVLTGAALDGVDLRGVHLAEVEGVGSLAGAVLDDGQLQQLAPALAAHLGITVAPG